MVIPSSSTYPIADIYMGHRWKPSTHAARTWFLCFVHSNNRTLFPSGIWWVIPSVYQYAALPLSVIQTSSISSPPDVLIDKLLFLGASPWPGRKIYTLGTGIIHPVFAYLPNIAMVTYYTCTEVPHDLFITHRTQRWCCHIWALPLQTLCATRT